jgi:hypothetical protein
MAVWVRSRTRQPGTGPAPRSRPSNQVCIGVIVQRCIGDPGGKINVTLNLSDLADDISSDPMAHPPVNPCASTTWGNLVAVDDTEEQQGNFDGYGWSSEVPFPRLVCSIPLPHALRPSLHHHH